VVFFPLVHLSFFLGKKTPKFFLLKTNETRTKTLCLFVLCLANGAAEAATLDAVDLCASQLLEM
jgi:hypothetical protein